MSLPISFLPRKGEGAILFGSILIMSLSCFQKGTAI